MMTESPFTVSDDHRELETRVSFNADEPLTLTASNASGRVAVRTDASLPSGTIRVTATRTDHGTFEDDDHHFNVKVEDNAISVHPDWQFASGVSGLARRIRDQLQHGFRPEDWNLSRLRLSPELDFDIAITLPAGLAKGSQVKVRTASGEVDIGDVAASTSVVTASGDVAARGLTGTVAIHTASGDVEATDITDSLEANTASGDVAIRGGDAWLAARSASGDVEIRDLALRNARVTTVSGDVVLVAPFTNTAAPANIETVSGDVRIDATLPGSGAGATLGFGTLSGSSSVSGAWEKEKRRAWRAGSGERAIAINVKTVSGDLSATATLASGVEARALDLPVGSAAEAASAQDFKHEMKQFGKEMKAMGKEMKAMGKGMDGAFAPPVPPTPPTPPADTGHDDHIFTAGPAGRPYRAHNGHETEPVSPPEPFTDEPSGGQPAEATASDTAPVEAPADEPVEQAPPEQDERLRLLEAVERGEMDIEEALAQLNDDTAGDQEQR